MICYYYDSSQQSLFDARGKEMRAMIVDASDNPMGPFPDYQIKPKTKKSACPRGDECPGAAIGCFMWHPTMKQFSKEQY